MFNTERSKSIGILVINGRFFDLAEYNAHLKQSPLLQIVPQDEDHTKIEGVAVSCSVDAYFGKKGNVVEPIRGPRGKVIGTWFPLNNDPTLSRICRETIDFLNQAGLTSGQDMVWKLLVVHSLIESDSLTSLGLTSDHLYKEGLRGSLRAARQFFDIRPTLTSVEGSVEITDPSFYETFTERYSILPSQLINPRVIMVDPNFLDFPK